MATAMTPVTETAPVSTRPAGTNQVALMAVSAVVLGACLPLVTVHFQQLWARPHYQFFPIVLIGAVLLAVARFRRIESLQPGSRWVSWGMAGFAWMLLAVAELVHSPWPAAIATLVVMMAAIHAAGGWSLVRKMLPPWLFLWLIIPLPFGLDAALVQGLQHLTSYWSSAVLDLFGIVHVFSGNVVEVAGQRLLVEEACAGVNSLFSILACTLFYILFARVPVVRGVFLTLAAVSWVLLANVARVVLIAYLIKTRGIDLTIGWRHDAVGYVLFALALVLIWSSDRLLMFVASPRSSALPPTPAGGDTPTNPATIQDALACLQQSWLTSWIAASVFGLVLVAHLLVHGLPTFADPVGAADRADMARLDAGSLPANLDGWRREDFSRTSRAASSAFGEFSSTWTYRADSYVAIVSVDYPYPFWHDSHGCYLYQGWELEELTDQKASGSHLPEFYQAAKFKKAGMKSAYLFYGQFDQAGRNMEPLRGAKGALERYELALERWTNWPNVPAPRQVGTVAQVQLFIESQSTLSPAEIAKSEQRFLEAYRLVHLQLFPAEKP
jgi:exosortase